MNLRQLLILPVLLLAACGRQEVPPEVAASITDAFPENQFLTFPNAQLTLPPGDYTLVAATVGSGSSGPYDLDVTFDDGRTQHFSGTWPGSSGDSANGNPHFVRLQQAGGIKLKLRRSGAVLSAPRVLLFDRSGKSFGEASGTLSGDTWSADLIVAPSTIGAAQYSNAYYATIDPLNQRDTFDKWKAVNGFVDGAPDTVHVVFLDQRDLGYGRNMTMRRTTNGGVAVYVENYLVPDFGGGYAYSTLSLDAAIARSARYLIGINTIEWGPVDGDNNGALDDLNGDSVIDNKDFVTQFYSFAPKAPNARQLTVDMDGKGPKAMPTTCIACHGGRAFPLLASGKLPFSANTRAQLQPMDLDSFGYSAQAGYTRTEQEAAFKLLNQAVYDSYAPGLQPAPPAFPNGLWNSAVARQMLESWYRTVDDPPAGSGLTSDHFVGGFVPKGWRPAAAVPGTPADPTTTPPTAAKAPVPAVPDRADQLYTQVVAPYCMTCHLLRGNSLESTDATTGHPFGGNDLDFTSFIKFSDYGRAVQGLVFSRGNMPLARLPYEHFRADTAGQELLASFLPGPLARDANGALLQAGRPLASAGPARTSPSPVQVSGAASMFAEQYLWNISAQPAGSVATLDDPGAERVQLTADTDGVYTLQLRVFKDGVTSAPASVNITINSVMAKAPKNLTFEADIRPFVTNPANCGGCHKNNGPPFNTSLPMNLNDSSAAESHKVYLAMRGRIDFTRPDFSPLLTKPNGSHHFGTQRPGFNTAPGGDRSNYDLFLNWILEGAREN